MAQQPPNTIICPSCGTKSVHAADYCDGCGLALAPVRELLSRARPPRMGNPELAHELERGAGVRRYPPPPPPPPPSIHPPPPPPQQHHADQAPAASSSATAAASLLVPPKGYVRVRREGDSDLGHAGYSDQKLFRGMGTRRDQVTRLFLQQSAARDVPGVTYSHGGLEADGEVRNFYFVERDLGSYAAAIVAVRIDSLGTDLCVEWRHFTRYPREFSIGTFLFLGLLTFAFFSIMFGLLTKSAEAGMVIGGFAGFFFGAAAAPLSRAEGLKGFQSQDRDTFQSAIHFAIEEAIDLAGIAKSLGMDVESGTSHEDRRLI